MKDRKEYARRVIFVFLLAAYLIFNGILLMRHEFWRDEANVWLIGKNLNLLQLFGEIKYQGHPCLWYLLVMPFAKLGLPFPFIGIVSFGVMILCTGLFVWKAPLHPVTKAVVLFSPIFTYFYPVIARNYCLIALIMILLAVCFPARNKHEILYGILLGLLVQADTIAIAEAGMISLMWLCESIYNGRTKKSYVPVRNVLRGIWIPLVSFLLWIAQFYQISDSPVFKIRNLELGEFVHEIKNYSYGILIRMTGWNQIACLCFFLVFLALALMASVRLKNGWPLVVMIVAFAFQSVFSVTVYQLHMWHYISLCFVWIWMIWIFYHQQKERNIQDKVLSGALAGLQILLVIFAFAMFLHWNSEDEASNLDNALHGLYSDGVNAAEYIKENVSKDDLIVSTDIAMDSTILAYLGEYDFYYAGSGQIATYADWSEEQKKQISLEELLEWVEASFPEKDRFYLIKTSDSCLLEADALKECEVFYRTEQETARGEEYTIYQIEVK